MIITQYDLPDWKRNMNQYQRPYHGSVRCDVTLIVRRGAEVGDELRDRVRVVEAPVRSKASFYLYAAFTLLRLRTSRRALLLTDPSASSLVGAAARAFGGYFWVLDIWDPPRRRLDATGKRLPATLSDRVVFAAMNLADFVVFSGLQGQAPRLRLRDGEWLEFGNAIDLRDIADSPPSRSVTDPTLHVAMGRSILHEESGLREVVEAAERLQRKRCPVRIHLVGRMTDPVRQLIDRSPAASMFECHGFVATSRSDFFRNVHVGLVPYRATDDLSYIYPIKVMEHLSQGNPVIATRLPGLARMIRHEHDGLLFEPGDVGALADAIARLQSDRALWQRLSENAIDSSRRYDAHEKNSRIFDALIDRLHRAPMAESSYGEHQT